MNQPFTPQPGSPLLDHSPASLPAADYFDPARFELERRQIWARHWIYAGRASDHEPKTVRRLEIAGQQLILVRDAEGAFTCFYNTCRHRGSELFSAPETRLKSKLISCPYHLWSYALDGRLVSTPYVSVTPDFCKQDHGLFRVHVKAWNGFVYVCLADDPPDFDAAFDLGAGALDNWPMADLVTGHTLVKDMACNWKVFWENYNECLHCPGIHPELSDMVPVYRRGYMAPNEDPKWTPDTPVPVSALKPGAHSWTMTGELCGPEFPGLTPDQREAGQLFVTMLPTMYIVAHADYVRAVSLTPLGPEKTRLRAEWLFPKATLDAPGFDLAAVVDFASIVMLQDGAACEMNQRGLHSDRFARGTLMPQEYDVHRFQNWVRAKAGAPAETSP